MPEFKRTKVAAVVVTYNRKHLLSLLLDALIRQSYPLTALYIVDNASSDGTPFLLFEKGYADRRLFSADNPQAAIQRIAWPLSPDEKIGVHYIRLPENTGGAGGFYEGIKRAFSGEHDWIWLLDDDVIPESDCLANLLEKERIIEKSNLPAPSALACARYYSENEFVVEDCKRLNFTNPLSGLWQDRVTENDLKKEFLKIEGMTFEGMFLNQEYITRVGFPDRRFFICADDYDYCLRLRKFGDIYYIPSARIRRQVRPVPLGDLYTWKSYFVIRNLIYLDFKYGNSLIKVVRTLGRMVRLVVGRIYHWGLKDLGVLFLAIRDAIRMSKQNYDYFN